jgi:hypothetical protein
MKQRPCSWRRQVPSKRRLPFNGLHGVTFQKTGLFITTAARTSNPTQLHSNLKTRTANITNERSAADLDSRQAVAGPNHGNCDVAEGRSILKHWTVNTKSHVTSQSGKIKNGKVRSLYWRIHKTDSNSDMHLTYGEYKLQNTWKTVEVSLFFVPQTKVEGEHV